MSIKIALPKGRLLSETAGLLQKAGWSLQGYRQGTRNYNVKSRRFADLSATVFQEKDIPIQVAIGNYDLGICSSDWIEELLVKYPSLALIKLRNLGYGDYALYMVASRSELSPTGSVVSAGDDGIRIVSEYPNLAEAFALNLRLKRFRIFPLWGAAEAYPPENADLALISGGKDEVMFNHDLVVISNILEVRACLITNQASYEKKDLSELLNMLDNRLPDIKAPFSLIPAVFTVDDRFAAMFRQESPVSDGDLAPQKVEKPVWLALPDGHQQEPTLELLRIAGIQVDDYPSVSGNRRPVSGLAGVKVKVIRPQDMPLQVANGNFDIAITGQDWLREHLCQFPSSPVTELASLQFGRVRLVAVVGQDVPVDDMEGLRRIYSQRSQSIRVASEYVNIADWYARDKHLGMYRVIPTWGASEAFLPDDADLLIENTETGETIARHNLKIIDTLFESVACLIGNKDSVASPDKAEIIKDVTRILGSAAGASSGR
jgi:ATP phosphoribosyltransferase